jgi:hypothetical protein
LGFRLIFLGQAAELPANKSMVEREAFEAHDRRRG